MPMSSALLPLRRSRAQAKTCRWKRHSLTGCARARLGCL